MIFGEAPANRSAEWHQEPTVRGSFDILSTCILTLLLCVWTSVHLNIPAHEVKPRFKAWNPVTWVPPQTWRKVGWLILGLLAPEMVCFLYLLPLRPETDKAVEVAFCAWAQYREARRIAQQMNQLLNIVEHVEPSRVPRDPDHDIELNPVQDRHVLHQRWTTVHGFYALMGGFAFDTSDVPKDEKFLPGSRERVTITPEALEVIAEHEPTILEPLTEAQIKDKSKANALAKGIVCIQALWFIAQSISRLAQGLSISLLELNTAAHALCALLAYCLWWGKPLDIEEPTIIKGTDTHVICAYLCQWCSWTSDERLIRYNERAVDEKPVSCLPFPANEYEDQQQASDQTSGLSFDGVRRATKKLYAGQKIEGVYFPVRHDQFPLKIYSSMACSAGILGIERDSMRHDNRDRRRWALLSKGLDKYSGSPSDIRALQDRMHRRALCGRMQNFPDNFDFFQFFGDVASGLSLRSLETVSIVFFLAFTFAGLCYGGIHLLAWQAPFTSDVQHILWQISALAVTGSGPAFLIIYTLSWIRRRLTYSRGWNALFGLVIFSSLLFCYLALMVLYMLARLYLVVECFISFAYLPDTVFLQPSWSNYFPHIG